MRFAPSALPFLLPLLVCSTARAQGYDEAYGDKIREYTTDERFLSDLVDHLPASESVPSPLDFFGDIVGAPGTLHHVDEIYAYLRALAEASPRVLVRSVGATEEGREMIEIVVAGEEVLASLDAHRTDLARLADPRDLSEEEADAIVERARPVYYVTAGLHSPETGSLEMVMELAYRLAAGESPLIRSIRDNVIFVVLPVAEPDGRDRIVDTYAYRAAHREIGPGLSYWGHYVAHDNNRDGYGLGLALTRNVLASFFHWTPQVMHDLHESVSYLYVSTGLGPYNEALDPIAVNEWHNLAHEEVSQLTRRGMPGVWTHAFYTGWAANYLIWIANTRNSLGRFYETFGNSIPDTKERKLTDRQTSREWYRTNPPLEKTLWSLRNNTNYMQSGVLTALAYTAENRREFVENFLLKSRRSVERGRTETPHAWIMPKIQHRPLGTVELVNLLMQQGLEVHALREPWADSTFSVEAGSWVVRMDQPYRPLAETLLDKQTFPEGGRAPYDDTGWTLPLLHGVQAVAVDDPAILNAPMDLLEAPVEARGGVERADRPFLALNHTTDDALAVFRFRLSDVDMAAAEEPFEADGNAYRRGSLLIETRGRTGRIESVARELGLTLRGLDALPDVATHDVDVPRVALVHTWVSTPQDAGWWRMVFDRLGIPYAYLSEQDLAADDLTAYDVLVMPQTRASSQLLVAGHARVGDPVPWRTTEETPHLGKIDETDDQRAGMGYVGLAHLKAFLDRGGVFITEGRTAAFPIDMALTRRVRIKSTPGMTVRGSVLKAGIADPASPITYGYADSLAVYFNQAPVFDIDDDVGNYRLPDWFKDELWEAEVPRVVLEFAKKDLLLSGMARGEAAMAGSPAAVDVPVGKGHVILFANRPMRRLSTHGSHALVFNAMLHWNDLRTGWPERPGEDEEEE